MGREKDCFTFVVVVVVVVVVSDVIVVVVVTVLNRQNFFSLYFMTYHFIRFSFSLLLSL